MGRAEYVIYEMPRKKPCSESPCTEKPYMVNPDTDTPVTKNNTQLSTNKISTDTINKREKKEIQHRYGSYENVLLSDAEYGNLRQEIIRCGLNGSRSIWPPPAGATKITLPQSGVGQREKSRSITRQTTHLRKETAYERHGA